MQVLAHAIALALMPLLYMNIALDANESASERESTRGEYPANDLPLNGPSHPPYTNPTTSHYPIPQREWQESATVVQLPPGFGPGPYDVQERILQLSSSRMTHEKQFHEWDSCTLGFVARCTRIR